MQQNAEARPLHTDCPFSGHKVCRCIYGNSVLLRRGTNGQSGGGHCPSPAATPAAAEYMQRARAAWRILHHPDSALHDQRDPVVLWLPKLQRRPPPASARSGQPSTSAAAAAVRMEQAERVVRAAVLRAAAMAAAAGLSYQPPQHVVDQLMVGGGGVLDLSGLVQADHSELERQVQAVRWAQEARQLAASRAAAAASMGVHLPLDGAGPEGEAAAPLLVPMDALGSATPDAPHLAGHAPSPSEEGALAGGRPVRRTLSDASARGCQGHMHQPHSLPLPSTSGGAGASRPRRSPAGKPPPKPSPRAGHAGPGKGPRGGKGAAAKQQAGEARRGASAGGSTGSAPPAPAHPNLSLFGEGYEPRGPSTATPPKPWLLRMADFRPALQGKLIQTFWPDGGHWWPAVVLTVSLPTRTCSLYYETGDEESVQFARLIQAGEVAWLHAPDALPAAPTRSGSADGQLSGPPPSPSLQPLADKQQPADGGGGRLKGQRSDAAAAGAPIESMNGALLAGSLPSSSLPAQPIRSLSGACLLPDDRSPACDGEDMLLMPPLARQLGKGEEVGMGGEEEMLALVPPLHATSPASGEGEAQPVSLGPLPPLPSSPALPLLGNSTVLPLEVSEQLLADTSAADLRLLDSPLAQQQVQQAKQAQQAEQAPQPAADQPEQQAELGVPAPPPQQAVALVDPAVGAEPPGSVAAPAAANPAAVVTEPAAAAKSAPAVEPAEAAAEHMAAAAGPTVGPVVLPAEDELAAAAAAADLLKAGAAEPAAAAESSAAAAEPTAAAGLKVPTAALMMPAAEHTAAAEPVAAAATAAATEPIAVAAGVAVAAASTAAAAGLTAAAKPSVEVEAAEPANRQEHAQQLLMDQTATQERPSAEQAAPEAKAQVAADEALPQHAANDAANGEQPQDGQWQAPSPPQQEAGEGQQEAQNLPASAAEPPPVPGAASVPSVP